MQVREIGGATLTLADGVAQTHEVVGGPTNIGVTINLGTATSCAIQVSTGPTDDFVNHQTALSADGFVPILVYVRKIKVTATGGTAVVGIGYVK